MNKENCNAITFIEYKEYIEQSFEKFIEYHAEQYLLQLSQNKDYEIQDIGWMQFPFNLLLGGLQKRFPSHKIQLEKSYFDLSITTSRPTYRFYSKIENKS
jgi:hypothetical protein